MPSEAPSPPPILAAQAPPLAAGLPLPPQAAPGVQLLLASALPAPKDAADTLIPYEMFAPLAALLAAKAAGNKLETLLTLPRGDKSPMATFKKACFDQRAKIDARLATLRVAGAGCLGGVVLRPCSAPDRFVMPRELLLLAVILTALTLYARLKERRGAVASDTVYAHLSTWAWTPASQGTVPWGAVSPTHVTAVLAAFKEEGSHSIVSGLLRGVDGAIADLRASRLLYLASRLPATLLAFDSDEYRRLAFASGNEPRAIMVPLAELHYVLRGLALSVGVVGAHGSDGGGGGGGGRVAPSAVGAGGGDSGGGAMRSYPRGVGSNFVAVSRQSRPDGSVAVGYICGRWRPSTTSSVGGVDDGSSCDAPSDSGSEDGDSGDSSSDDGSVDDTLARARQLSAHAAHRSSGKSVRRGPLGVG